MYTVCILPIDSRGGSLNVSFILYSLWPFQTKLAHSETMFTRILSGVCRFHVGLNQSEKKKILPKDISKIIPSLFLASSARWIKKKPFCFLEVLWFEWEDLRHILHLFWMDCDFFFLPFSSFSLYRNTLDFFLYLTFGNSVLILSHFAIWVGFEFLRPSSLPLLDLFCLFFSSAVILSIYLPPPIFYIIKA